MLPATTTTTMNPSGEHSPPQGSSPTSPTTASIPIIDTTTVDEHEMATRPAPPRRQPATDVVLVNSADTPVIATEACDAAGAEPRPQRTYGEVYPIMRDTIYSDEECEVEVEVKMTDCGVRFVRYLNGLFQYLVRNPKVMGFILTTVIILLFFKYSQQVVVKAVLAALNAHPGLEPSDELRSGVVAFTQEMDSLMLVVKTLAATFAREGIIGYLPTTLNTTNTSFLNLAASFQESFTANYDTFVLYKMPDSTHWGQVGCQSASNDSTFVDVTTVCLTTLEDGTARIYNGSDTSLVLKEVPNSYAESVRGEWPVFTSQNATRGVWTSAADLRSFISDKTEYVITYLFPVAFSNNGTTCTAMAGMDVKVAALASAVNTTTANIEVVVVDLQHKLNFLLDSFDTSLHWTSPSYKVSETPVKRINDVATPILQALVPGLVQTPPGHKEPSTSTTTKYTLTDGAFYADGLFYQGLSVMDNWALLASSPLALSVAEAAASYLGSVREYENVLRASTSAYGTGCVSAADTKSTCRFLQAVADVENTFGSKVYSLYVLHIVEPQTTTTTTTTTTSTTTTTQEPTTTTTTTTSSTQEAVVNSTTTTTSSTEAAADNNSTTTTTPEASSTTTTTSTTAEADTTTSTTTSTTAEADTTTSTTAEAETTTTSTSTSTSTTTTTTTTSTAEAVRVRTASTSADSTSSSTTVWGTSGCTYTTDSATRKCFYTNSDGTVTVFLGDDLPSTNWSTTLPFADTRRSQFLTDYVLPQRGTLTRTSGGFWTVPYHVEDVIALVNLTAMSYVLPFEFDEDGEATAVAVFDLSLTWIPEFLAANKHNGTTDLVLIDRRETGVFMGSATRTADTVYAAMNTPDKNQINKWTTALYKQSGNSFAHSLSFHSGPTLINYRTVSSYWGIIEVMSADEALQRYLPTPAVSGATDALRLMPTGETVTLFLYVAGILLAYFLNLVILSCSRLGRREQPKLKQQ